MSTKRKARGAAIKGRRVKSDARRRTLFKPGALNPRHTNPKSGRKKGTPNKVTRDIREAIVNTLFDRLRGEEYLQFLAVHEGKAFAGLIAKAMPLQLEGTDGKPIKQSVAVDVNFIEPKEKSK